MPTTRRPLLSLTSSLSLLLAANRTRQAWLAFSETTAARAEDLLDVIESARVVARASGRVGQ